MNSPLIDRLTTELGYPLIERDQLDAFSRAHEHSVLFFTEDPRSFPETNDVAVILPELMRVFGDRVAPAVVGRQSERELMKRFGFGAWPALVFLRRGEYLGVITRVLDWDDYLAEIERLLQAEPTRAPGIGIPVVSATSAGGCAGNP